MIRDQKALAMAAYAAAYRVVFTREYDFAYEELCERTCQDVNGDWEILLARGAKRASRRAGNAARVAWQTAMDAPAEGLARAPEGPAARGGMPGGDGTRGNNGANGHNGANGSNGPTQGRL